MKGELMNWSRYRVYAWDEGSPSLLNFVCWTSDLLEAWAFYEDRRLRYAQVLLYDDIHKEVLATTGWLPGPGPFPAELHRVPPNSIYSASKDGTLERAPAQPREAT